MSANVRTPDTLWSEQGDAEDDGIDPVALQHENAVRARTVAELGAIRADIGRMRQRVATFVAKSWWRRLLEPF